MQWETLSPMPNLATWFCSHLPDHFHQYSRFLYFCFNSPGFSSNGIRWLLNSHRELILAFHLWVWKPRYEHHRGVLGATEGFFCHPRSSWNKSCQSGLKWNDASLFACHNTITNREILVSFLQFLADTPRNEKKTRCKFSEGSWL